MTHDEFIDAVPESDTKFRFAALTDEGHLITGLLSYATKDLCRKWLAWHLGPARWLSLLAPGEL